MEHGEARGGSGGRLEVVVGSRAGASLRGGRGDLGEARVRLGSGYEEEMSNTE